MVIMVITTLLCRSVLAVKPAPLHFCPENGLRASVLRVPPYIMSSNSGEVEGILGDFFTRLTRRCFIQGCGLPRNAIHITLFNSTDDFLSALQENKTDIAFPISGPVMMRMRDSAYGPRQTGPLLAFEVFLQSAGYFLIMDVEHVNSKVTALELMNLLQNSWPIVVFTLLIAGISGMVVWILVCQAIYQVSLQRYYMLRFRVVHQSTLTLFQGSIIFVAGGTVGSWLVCPSPDRAVRVLALAGNIVLCSWARDFTLTLPLSTQVYKWVLANLMMGVTL